MSLDVAEGGQQIVEPEAYSHRHETSWITVIHGEQERHTVARDGARVDGGADPVPGKPKTPSADLPAPGNEIPRGSASTIGCSYRSRSHPCRRARRGGRAGLASRAIPAPLIPPPITRRSRGSRAISARIEARIRPENSNWVRSTSLPLITALSPRQRRQLHRAALPSSSPHGGILPNGRRCVRCPAMGPRHRLHMPDSGACAAVTEPSLHAGHRP